MAMMCLNTYKGCAMTCMQNKVKEPQLKRGVSCQILDSDRLEKLCLYL